MITANITINGEDHSQNDLTIGVLVSLANYDDTGVTAWQWSFVSTPPNSTAVILTPTSSTARFTPDLVGSYIIKLVVYNVNGKYYSDEKIGAVKTTNFAYRIPGEKETIQYDAYGWSKALYDVFTNIDTNAALHDGYDGTILIGSLSFVIQGGIIKSVS